MRASWPGRRGDVVETRGGSMFTGVVWGEVLLPHDAGSGVNRVTFAPGSRTFWHRHAGGQMLIGCAGGGLVVTRDGVVGIGEGAVVHAFAGEEHWHGALPDSFLSHQSIVLGGATDWLDEVSEEEYLAAVASLRALPRLPGPPGCPADPARY
jgi:quercetin dioxygenase-like cupin family protein